MQPVGFIGLGVMGQPMALNLARAGVPLVVWNRSESRCAALRDAGADIAATPADVLELCRVVILMLFDEASTDGVLSRGGGVMHGAFAGRMIINMSSVAPDYSRALAEDVQRAGGRFVEAPVSGSRVPAEGGQLVAMLAGDEAVCDEVRPVLAPMCREAVYCGPIGNALLMKLSINIFMLCSAVGLAEAFHFAGRNGLPLERFQEIANASQMASQLSRIKLAKLMAGDWSKQGSVQDGVNNTALIVGAADRAHVAADLIRVCQTLFGDAQRLGHGADDMIAVIRAMEARSRASTSP